MHVCKLPAWKESVVYMHLCMLAVEGVNGYLCQAHNVATRLCGDISEHMNILENCECILAEDMFGTYYRNVQRKRSLHFFHM